KVYSNNQQVNFTAATQDGRDRSETDNWYTWENSFPPQDSTHITVYFIVNTNNTTVREGYNTDERNGFIYILETGATWKQPIREGEIKIQLMNDLELEDIEGISPDSIF